MAKFYGAVGYGIQTETAPGVWEDVIVERNYYGDVSQVFRRLEDGQAINGDITTSTIISIMADAFAEKHFFAIRYIQWSGAKWIVTSVDVRRPRLELRLGGVYNGQQASSTETA